MPAMMKVCHLDLPSTEKLPQRLQWADSLLLQCLQDLPQGSNQGQALSTQLPGKTKHSRGTRAWQFPLSLKLLYEQSLHQCSPLGWLRLSQSCIIVWVFPDLSSFAFTFLGVRLALGTVGFLCPLCLSLLFKLQRCYLHYISCISNSIFATASGRAWTNRKKWVSVCVIYWSRKPISEDLQSDHFPSGAMGVVLCYLGCSAFPIPHPIKACSEMNLGLSNVDLSFFIINHRLFLL